MIIVNIKSDSKEKKDEFAKKLHEAFKGWPAYINNDLLINTRDDDEIYLVIGPENGNDIEMDINLEDIKDIRNFIYKIDE